MSMEAARWTEVTSSPFAHEAEGLAQIRALLPDVSPFRAWSNFEFRDGQGKWHEIDLLVLGRRRLHLVELKYYSGVLRGDDRTWLREGRPPEDSPLLLAHRKAQRLAGRFRDELQRWTNEVGRRPGERPHFIPFVQAAVYLHHPGFRCLLPSHCHPDLFSMPNGTRSSGLPGIDNRLLEVPEEDRAVSPQDEELVCALVARIGLVQRRQREAGSWLIEDAPIAEGDGYQDWPAFHRVAMTERARIRFFVPAPGAPVAENTRVKRVVEHEFQIMRGLQHDGLLRPLDLVETELGTGLVFPDDDRYQRLDLWMAGHPEGLSLETQLALVRQLAEALSYAHRRRIVHRGLVPGAIQVRDRVEGGPRALVSDWQTVGVVSGSTLRTSPTSAVRTLVGSGASRAPGEIPGSLSDAEGTLAEAFRAPEGVWSPDADRVRLDVFALGALTYYIASGQPPATDRASLKVRLSRDNGLDLAAAMPQVPSRLRDLVLRATRPIVSDRLADVRLFLEGLGEVERVLAGDSVDPLEARPGATLDGRFRLERRLGSGSTAVGLLVTDLSRTGESDVRRVLKVARDDAASERLDGEAEVMRRLNHPRLVHLIDGPIEVGGRRALLVSSAGEETVADVLRARARLSLDLLERWGTDLLEAVLALDAAGITHRDIKPSNLGVLESRGDRRKHLVLFDFSLARASAASLTAGTPPYLDPFLDLPGRGRYDSAAERYAASVVLFEMATGTTPAYGDGLTDPSLANAEATVEPSQFDPSVAPGLESFFHTALARDTTSRHDTATEMLTAWKAVFASIAPAAHDADHLAETARSETPLSQAGLSPRGLSAVEPLGVMTAGELAALDPMRLNALSGVAESTRREVKERARTWRQRFGAVAPPSEPTAGAGGLLDALAAGQLVVDRARTGPQKAAARLLLGLDAGVDAFATPGQIANALHIKRTKATEHIGALYRAWAEDEQVREHFDAFEAATREALSALGGIGSVTELTDTVAATLPKRLAAGTSPPGRRIVVGLLARAIDRAPHSDLPAIQTRRRRDGQVVLLATDSSLLDIAQLAADRLDALLEDAPSDLLVPATRVAEALTADGLAGSLGPSRLIGIATSICRRAAVSGRGEIHSVDLQAWDALRLALAGLDPSQPISALEVRDRVRARFPAIPQLPDRPRMDELMAQARLPLVFDEGSRGYRALTRPGDTTSLASHTPSTPPPPDAADIRNHIGSRLRESIAKRSFLALGVSAERIDRASEVLAGRHGAVILDVTRVLLTVMRELAMEAQLPWETVIAADAALVGTREGRGLAALVSRALPTLEAQLEEALATTNEGSRPILLTELAPLARYGHLAFVAPWSDLTTHRRQAIWALVPQLAGAQGPVIDGCALPLAAPGQFFRIDSAWLSPEPPAESTAI